MYEVEVIKEYLKKNKLLVISFVIVTGVSSWFSAEFSAMLGRFFDVIDGSCKESMLHIVMVTSVYLSIFLGFELFSNLLKAYTIKGINIFVENNFAKKLYEKSISDYDKKDVTEYESFFINDIKQIQEMYIENLFQITNSIMRLLLSLIVLLKISIVGTGIVCVLSFLPIIFSIFINGPIMKQVAKFSTAKSEYIKNTTEALEGHEAFSLYGNRRAAIKRNRNINTMEADSKRKAFVCIESLSAIVGVSSISITVLALVGGMYLALHGYITVGEVFALSFISNGISSPLMELSDKIPNFVAGKAFLEKYMDFIKTIENKFYVNTLSPVKCIELEQVELGDERKILNNINLKIEKGKKYLFVGESGSGKSTAVKTLLGQNCEYNGRIYYNTVELNNISDKEIYRNISYIPQKSELFYDTIRNNVTVFNEKISNEEIYQVLDFVNMKEKVLNLPDGLNYCLTENKSNLSGGEKQRLALARNLLYRKPILIMDEATSALDNENFKDIEHKLVNLKNVTIINIVHRLRKDIVEQYDKVVEFKDGEIKGVYEAIKYVV